MKNTLKTLGLLLGLTFSIISCEKDDVNSNSEKEVSETNLKGTYVYQTANVQTAVDLNKDGVFNNDLFKEGYKSCTLDNQLVITETDYTFVMKGASCSVDEKDLSFTYKLDKEKKVITLYENEVESGKVENIEFYNGNGLKTYEYQVYDNTLKQNVVFIMRAIN